MNLIQQLEQEEIARLNKEIPEFAPGDTVVVSVRVVEGSRSRLQAYEGVVIARRNRGLNSNFIVRKISSGEGVERTFQLYSPTVEKIEVTDPACRLPLPTLFQHARGCSPWRPAADMGTARREIYTLSPGFSRASESSPDAAGTATLSKARAPLSGRTHSRAPCPSQRKENSPRGSRRLLRDRSRYRTGRLAAPISATPDSGI